MGKKFTYFDLELHYLFIFVHSLGLNLTVTQSQKYSHTLINGKIQNIFTSGCSQVEYSQMQSILDTRVYPKEKQTIGSLDCATCSFATVLDKFPLKGNSPLLSSQKICQKKKLKLKTPNFLNSCAAFIDICFCFCGFCEGDL